MKPAPLFLLLLGGCTLDAPTSSQPQPERPAGNQPAGNPSTVNPSTQAPAPSSGHVAWIASGGGPHPESNQVSIEQDLALAVELLGDNGRLFFAGGPNSNGVQVLASDLPKDPLRDQLGDIFSPRPGRNARYRRTQLAAIGEASRSNTLDAIQAALSQEGPLLLYLAGHGDRGEVAADNGLLMWGDQVLTAIDLAALLDRSPAKRTTRMVITSCFSGGFADLAFRAANPGNGPAATPRCGLFASTWDEPSSGCDPNPERRTQQGFAVHFLNALRGRDRLGELLPTEQLDLDGDGAISLLEAQARVRVASRSFDVPTTTSERWLRHAAPIKGPEDPFNLPIEQAVVAALSERLDLPPNLAAVGRLLSKLERAFAEADERLAEAERAEEQAFQRASADLLARWPVLDDPWHPLFDQTVTQEKQAILRHLADAPLLVSFRKVGRHTDQRASALERIREKKAPVLRLHRALENQQLAGRLHRQGGADWDRFLELRACENSSLAVAVGAESQ